MSSEGSPARNRSCPERGENSPSYGIPVAVSRRIFCCCTEQQADRLGLNRSDFVNNLSRCRDSHGGICSRFVSLVIFVKWLGTAGRMACVEVCAALQKWQPTANLLIGSKSSHLF